MRKCSSETGANSMLTGDQGAEGRADGSSPPPSLLLSPPLHQGFCALVTASGLESPRFRSGHLGVSHLAGHAISVNKNIE